MLDWSAIPTCPDFHTPSVRLENATCQPCGCSGQQGSCRTQIHKKHGFFHGLHYETIYPDRTPTRRPGYQVQWARSAGTPTTLPGAIWLGKLMFCKYGANNRGLGWRLRSFIFYTSPKTPVAYHRYRIDVHTCF